MAQGMGSILAHMHQAPKEPKKAYGEKDFLYFQYFAINFFISNILRRYWPGRILNYPEINILRERAKNERTLPHRNKRGIFNDLRVKY